MSGVSKRGANDAVQFRQPTRVAPILLQWTVWSILTFAHGCVVPLAPDFEDPPALPNYPPYFLNSEPGAQLAVTAPKVFTVTVVDPNPQDVLYARWVSDYPPFTQFLSKIVLSADAIAPNQPGGGTALMSYFTGGEPGSLKQMCADFIPSPNPTHSLALIVSDRPFLSTTQVAPNPDYRYNAIVAPDDVAIMQGWLVTCAQ